MILTMLLFHGWYGNIGFTNCLYNLRMRIYIIRWMAACFLIIGLWNVFLFFQTWFFGEMAELGFVVIGVVLFRTGDNLYSLQEIGRKITIGILGINILQIINAILLAVFQDKISFNWTGFGSLFYSNNGFLFAALVIPWITIDVLFGVLLLQEKTRLVFQNK